MSPNVDLLRRTLDHIQTHPESWDQESWAVQCYVHGAPCGTAGCFAGWAVLLAGHQIAFEGASVADPHIVRTVSGELIHKVARQELGLDDDQADELFSPGNSLEDLRRLVNELAAEAETGVSR